MGLCGFWRPLLLLLLLTLLVTLLVGELMGDGFSLSWGFELLSIDGSVSKTTEKEKKKKKKKKKEMAGCDLGGEEGLKE
jgi:hypothetical protein